MVTTEGLLNRARDASDLGSLMKQGIGGFLLALSTALISGVLTVADVFIRPARALGSALADLTSSIFGGPATIIDAGALSTALSIGPGGQFNVGPLSFALGIGAVLLGLFIVGRFREERETGNLIPGLPIDVPFIGQKEEGEE